MDLFLFTNLIVAHCGVVLVAVNTRVYRRMKDFR
jgi:hypothetical protein